MREEVLTLALIGTVGSRRLPRLLVEAGAAAVTGAPAGVVLAGALQPVGYTGGGLRPILEAGGRYLVPSPKGPGIPSTAWLAEGTWPPAALFAGPDSASPSQWLWRSSPRLG